ncbi:MAG: TadE/TadG family type IV pilus assembly protein [Pseudomonadota bacterium]
MSVSHKKVPGLAAKYGSSALRRFSKDKSGSAAIEFAMVFPIYLLMVLSLITSGLYYFTDSGLHNAVETASRKIRTGQVQTAGLTVDQFKQEICDAGTFLNCANLRVLLQRGSSWNEINPAACVENGTLSTSSGSTQPVSDFAGGAGDVVLVTACYEWAFTRAIGDIQFSKPAAAGGGNATNLATTLREDPNHQVNSTSVVIQASSAFRTEPYQ